MQKLLITFHALLIVATMFAGNNHYLAQTNAVLADSSYQKYVHTLKTGCLLVELSDRAGIRAKLLQYNETDKLRRFDLALEKEFNEITSAFLKYYNFGKVYFYLKSESHLLKQKAYHKMRWLNTSRIAVNSNEIDTNNFLLGTFARMERADSLLVLDSKGKIVGKEAKMSFQAFVFRDMKNRIIVKSYFLHVRTIFRNKTKVIRILNANLTKNYNSILKLKTKTNRNEN
jgi:hypothetical protein